MNKERILALADLIEIQPHTNEQAANGFTMCGYVHECGTPACIAGWACYLAKGAAEKDGSAAFYQAADYLEIGEETAPDLFLWTAGFALAEITPLHAAFTLRHLAATGNVNWNAYEASN